MSRIEWTEKTWNPVTGCTKCSPGCANCYAERMSKRLKGRFGYPADDPFRVTLHPDRINKPMEWVKPRSIFVVSMGDMFHSQVPFSFIEEVFDTFVCCPQHTFQVLTKRPDRMLEFSKQYGKFPENVWAGVTVCNQDEADKKIPLLLQVPAAVRFLSIEPMLGPIDLGRWIDPVQDEIWKCKKCGTTGHGNYFSVATGGDDYACACVECGEPCEEDNALTRLGNLDWVIVGGESGPGARPMHPDWVRSIRDQCIEAGVPYFFKQWGEYGLNWQNDENLNKIPDSEWMDKMGKKAAGRILDGETWDQMPEVNHA